MSQRIAKNAAALVASADSDPDIAALIAKDAGLFRDANNALARSGDAPRPPGARGEDSGGVVTELGKRAAAFNAGVSVVVQHTSRLVSAKQAARAVNNEAEAMLTDTTKLADLYEGGGKSRIPQWAAIILALLALGTLLLLGKVFLDDARVHAIPAGLDVP